MLSKHLGLSLRDRKVFAAILALVILCSSISAFIAYDAGVKAQSGSTTFTLTSGVYPGAPSYTVYTDGTTYYAKNSYGIIAYSSTNASYVLNSIAANSTIFIQGTISLTSSFVPKVGDSLIFDSNAMLTGTANPIVQVSAIDSLLFENLKIVQTVANNDGLQVLDNSRHITFSGKTVIINSAGVGANSHGIYLYGVAAQVYQITFGDTYVENFTTNVCLRGTTQSSLVDNVLFDRLSGHGAVSYDLYMNYTNFVTVRNFVSDAATVYEVYAESAQYTTIINSDIENSAHSMYIAWDSYITFIGGNVNNITMVSGHPTFWNHVQFVNTLDENATLWQTKTAYFNQSMLMDYGVASYPAGQYTASISFTRLGGHAPQVVFATPTGTDIPANETVRVYSISASGATIGLGQTASGATWYVNWFAIYNPNLV